MSDEDMTCLFCGRGGVSVMVIDEVTDPGCDIANVPIYAANCPYCGARGPMALSEDEAVAAWNRRAERTCSPIFGECSECRYPLRDHARYCSNCGARIKAVDE